ncbi:hypothetical protein [Aneurinibacillus aneurinilyticus]|uniref:Uncharacterized protein n=1 Tax=Aneurinibacillus aneurinilyticus TaxID=1391 RepID=A0A848D1Y8_ANEAE|nr:hypothetical protein [Aneurinibacillus aneurinilyticus]NMF00023.1 hypothetical protein [Aneurinibacillus aneurinilyticus]
MRKTKITGYVIYDENETGGQSVASLLEDLLFNQDYPREWSFEVESDEEIEWEDE